MKTNKFENTIRRKLESIQPDFQEQDWAKMQQYMKVHTPPTFWQQYSSWIGYAAAASVTSVMAFLYMGQLSQNDHLVSDIKSLKSQIEVIRNQPASTNKTDTIYLVQKEPVIEYRYITPQSIDPDQENAPLTGSERLADRNQEAEKQNTDLGENLNPESVQQPAGEIRDAHLSENPIAGLSEQSKTLAEKSAAKPGQANFSAQNKASNPISARSATNEPAMRNQYVRLESMNSIDLNNGISLTRKMNYSLANRLSSRQVQKALNSSNAAAADAQLASAKANKAANSDKKVENVAKAENVIPKLPLKVPYRFGGGLHFERNGDAKTIVGEVLVAKKFSITTGITWLKVKPMEFFNEKVFREKNRKDFKKMHPEEVPLAFSLYNITVNPTLVQIPLTVAFRNEIKDNWAYYAGVGTNISIKSKETISFDCKAPNGEFFTREFEKKMDIPAINSVNFSVGLEKTWHPIVFQAEGYLFTYFSPLTPLSQKAGPGLKLKLLYQIGQKM